MGTSIWAPALWVLLVLGGVWITAPLVRLFSRRVNAKLFCTVIERLIASQNLDRAHKLTDAAGEALLSRATRGMLLAYPALRGRASARAVLLARAEAELRAFEAEQVAGRWSLLRGAALWCGAALLWKVGAPFEWGRVLFFAAPAASLLGLVLYTWLGLSILDQSRSASVRLADALSAQGGGHA